MYSPLTRGLKHTEQLLAFFYIFGYSPLTRGLKELPDS